MLRLSSINSWTNSDHESCGAWRRNHHGFFRDRSPTTTRLPRSWDQKTWQAYIRSPRGLVTKATNFIDRRSSVTQTQGREKGETWEDGRWDGGRGRGRKSWRRGGENHHAGAPKDEQLEHLGDLFLSLRPLADSDSRKKSSGGKTSPHWATDGARLLRRWFYEPGWWWRPFRVGLFYLRNNRLRGYSTGLRHLLPSEETAAPAASHDYKIPASATQWCLEEGGCRI